jgi:hypothetical protein
MRSWRYRRPKMSGRAAFKTFLRLRGFSVQRNFYGFGCCIAKRNGRLWRFRFDDGVVDVSCLLPEFDRWANSTDGVKNIEQFKAEERKRK